LHWWTIIWKTKQLNNQRWLQKQLHVVVAPSGRELKWAGNLSERWRIFGKQELSDLLDASVRITFRTQSKKLFGIAPNLRQTRESRKWKDSAERDGKRNRSNKQYCTATFSTIAFTLPPMYSASLILRWWIKAEN
jgi:hypothetical protein